MKKLLILRAGMLAALVTTAAVGRPAAAHAGEVVLQDDKILAAFDSDSGALTRLENKETGWAVEGRKELGASFHLTGLTTDYKSSFASAAAQHATEVKKVSEREIQIRWDAVAGQHDDTLPVTLTATVTLTNGAFTFAATVKNDSPLLLENIDYPELGDLAAPKDGELEARHMWYGNLPTTKLGGTAAIDSKQSLFCLVESPEQGLYVEMHDPTQPYLLKFSFDHRGSNEASNNPVRTEFRATHVAYVHPGSMVRLAPVRVMGYRGDWHAGVDLYKAWRVTWFKQPHLPAWVQDVHSWQQLQIDSPEQDFRVPYTNLLAYGEECATNEVKAIQLVGWNHWGQDGGDPAQDIEPGLGTWQQLHDAVAQIQAKGVKMILFAKLNWADLLMPRYTNEFYKYECKDESGKRDEQGGYTYYTPTQLGGIGVHKRAVMDFQDPGYRDVATKEFEKILALGSEGWLWDEVCHHAGVLYNYAPGHGYTPPGYIYGGDLPLGAQLRAAADKVSPDFLFSGEAPEDWLLQYFPCSYFRINIDSTPVSRYVDPQAPLMVAVTGFDDREMLNLILLGRYIISYEPYNFKGHLTDYPLTLAYGKKIDALRRKYKEYLWDADFRDTLGAKVFSDGSTRYAVFVTSAGKRAVVVANMELSKKVNAQLYLPHAGKLVTATPEDPEARPAPSIIESKYPYPGAGASIPARSAVVFMEQ